MKLSEILVPYDGSEHSERALHYALYLAGLSPNSRVRVLHVMPSDYVDSADLDDGGTLDGVPIGLVDKVQYQGLVNKALERAKNQITTELKEVLAPFNDQVVVDAVADASPADAIVYYAKTHDTDLIVMGRRGVGGLRGVLGSVSYSVLHGSDAAVLTIK